MNDQRPVRSGPDQRLGAYRSASLVSRGAFPPGPLPRRAFPASASTSPHQLPRVLQPACLSVRLGAHRWPAKQAGVLLPPGLSTGAPSRALVSASPHQVPSRSVSSSIFPALRSPNKPGRFSIPTSHPARLPRIGLRIASPGVPPSHRPPHRLNQRPPRASASARPHPTHPPAHRQPACRAGARHSSASSAPHLTGTRPQEPYSSPTKATFSSSSDAIRTSDSTR